MTLWDFLAQAGFWTWIGLIVLAALLSQFRFWTSRTKHVHYHSKDKTP